MRKPAKIALGTTASLIGLTVAISACSAAAAAPAVAGQGTPAAAAPTY